VAAAATKLVRARGLDVNLVDAPFAQPLGRRRLVDVWRRQTRWARLRHVSFPHLFWPELLSGALLPLLAMAFVASMADAPVAASMGALAALWYGAEMALARAAGWHCAALYPVQAALRDLLLPYLWLDGLVGTEFVWRGNHMSIVEDGQTV
jgi:ceramide glucosyltransferase